MDDKITIIEGPPPTFEPVNEDWVLGLNECYNLSNVALTRLRTFNGPALVERCHRAWSQQNSIHLEYRDMDGLERLSSILAARTMDVEDGQLLFLWARLDVEEVELEAGLDDDVDDDFGFLDS